MTVENEEPTDDQLFMEAIGDEPETPETPIAEVEQPETPAEEVVAETPAEKPAVDDNAPQVPSWRVREINEEKRAAIAERDALKAERDEFKRLVEETRRKPTEPTKEEKAAEKAAKPDSLLDPDGYEKYIEAKVEEKLLNNRREESLLRARDANQQEFDEAYQASLKAMSTGDVAIRARMQSSRDPGKTLLDWHREIKVKAEVGSDPNAWLEKKLEERLKDPTFLAKAVELARGSAPQQNNGRPRVELPPSLNGASRSNAALKSADLDVSDHELFEQITG